MTTNTTIFWPWPLDRRLLMNSQKKLRFFNLFMTPNFPMNTNYQSVGWSVGHISLKAYFAYYRSTWCLTNRLGTSQYKSYIFYEKKYQNEMFKFFWSFFLSFCCWVVLVVAVGHLQPRGVHKFCNHHHQYWRVRKVQKTCNKTRPDALKISYCDKCTILYWAIVTSFNFRFLAPPPHPPPSYVLWIVVLGRGGRVSPKYVLNTAGSSRILKSSI